MELFTLAALGGIVCLSLFLVVAILQVIMARRQIAPLQQALSTAREQMIRAETEQVFLQEQLVTERNQVEALKEQAETWRKELTQANQAEQLALQKLEQAEQYRKEWELHRQEFEKAARASVMAAGQELSSKLLTDHKREAEEVKVKIEEKNRHYAEQYLQQFRALADSVAAVRQVSLESKKQSDILWRTMSSPSSAGQLTEVALENLLKNLGLREGVDFKLQASVMEGDGAGLRPDCVIYLPFDRLMIIDCKASKYQLELESVESEEARGQAQEKFRTAMLKHLEMLSRKGYMAAMVDAYHQRTGRKPHHQIINVMYIASDAAVEKLDAMDSSFREKMQKAGIIPVGPSGLYGLCSIASMDIAEARKSENHEQIIHEIERLIAGFSQAFVHLEKLGNNLQSAATSFGSFTGSYNRNVAPKLRHLTKLGVKPEGKQKMPERLPVYELHKVEAGMIIDGTGEALGDVPGETERELPNLLRELMEEA
jgi:DNA recombination protein RmuC